MGSEEGKFAFLESVEKEKARGDEETDIGQGGGQETGGAAIGRIAFLYIAGKK